VEYATFVEHVRADGSKLADAADGNITTAVPSCPGWTVLDLVAHIAQVYEHKIQCTRLGHAPQPWPPAWPGADEPVPWFRDAHARLLEMFDESEPMTPSATWWPPDQTVGFWARRMAQETAVHRVDAELASGGSTPVDAELATDGVDEILKIMLEGDWSEDADDAMTGQRIAISTGVRTWQVVLDREAVSVSEGGDDADAGVTGDPSNVLLWLWGRAADDQVERSGDTETHRLMRTRLTLATQ
jgi:uncharacterized protein (TIGR03083 family)